MPPHTCCVWHARMHLDMPSDAHRFTVLAGADSGGPRVQAWVQSRGGRALIAEGIPEAFGDGGSSYFDRLWASRSKQRRFHIAVGKPAVAATL